ncbi:MAG: aminotransferase class III-fold pyridoxal phosphate-dependent enzyme, partial [Bacteroidia bacterium]
LVGGYGEARPIYTTDAYKVAMNEGFEYRTIHLGTDFWTKTNTAVFALEKGKIVLCYDNNEPKDYGGTIILQHETENLTFYTLYGHLSRASLAGKHLGQSIEKGEKIGELGNFEENGNWASHLHFQIILDRLGLENNFYGVTNPYFREVFLSICPDPNLLFCLDELESKKYQELDNQLDYRKKHLGKSLSLSYKQPLTIVRGEQQYLIDRWGQKYLDTVNNVAHVGHEHPAVVAAGQSQMAILNTNTRYLNQAILDFAAELLKTFPPELSVLHFVNSGSEANELALRMAKAATGEKDILAIEVGYHGNTQACIDISSYKFNGKGGAGCPEHTHIVPLPDTFRGLYQGENAGLEYAHHVQSHVERLATKGRKPAAFIAESIVSCGGQIDLPENFLQKAYEYARAAGAVCIADEVQVGFGRVGEKFWGFELHNVMPDIVTMGKPIGNGHPLAAVVCTAAVAAAFANGMEYFNTFGGNPVSCAIGKTVLSVIQSEQLQENAKQVGAYLKAKLRLLQEKYPILADIRGEGLFLGIELTDSQKNPLAEQTSYLSNRMKDFKILTSTDGPQYNVLKIKPPMCFSMENADTFLAALERILQEDFLLSQR